MRLLKWNSDIMPLLVLVEMYGSRFPDDEGRRKHDCADEQKREGDDEQITLKREFKGPALRRQPSLAVIEQIRGSFWEA